MRTLKTCSCFKQLWPELELHCWYIKYQIQIHTDSLSIYDKDTNTGQYTSYSAWHYETFWISSLVRQAVNICNKNKLQAQLTRTKDLIE